VNVKGLSVNAIRRITTAALIAGTTLAVQPALAQLAGLQRTDLIKRDLGIAGRETVQTRVDFAPDAVAPAHAHPGEEIAYVLQGTLEYRIDGGAPVTLRAGQSLFIPAGATHSAKNVGSGTASELATYVVDKSTPLVVLAP
jgi:quercetin dioxygenase-like cupin family protein